MPSAYRLGQLRNLYIDTCTMHATGMHDTCQHWQVDHYHLRGVTKTVQLRFATAGVEVGCCMARRLLITSKFYAV